MRDQKVICRFCLDSHITKRNPLIAPCICKVSMGHVHLLCLDQWRVMDMDKNGSHCGLCLTEYTTTQHPLLELLPQKDSASSLLLRMPLLPAFALHYMYIIPLSINKQSHDLLTYNTYVRYQFLFQLGYLVLFLSQIRVKNKQEYWIQWRQQKSLGLFMIHLALLISLLFGAEVAGISIDMFMGFYWIRHCQILENINNKLMLEE